MMRFCATLLLWLSASAGGLAVAAANGSPAPFTLATYNIYFRNHSLSNIVTAIQEARADVVALQETNPQSEQHLRQALGGAYPHQEYRAGDRLSNGLGVLSRSPLRNLRYLPPRHGAYGSLLAEVTLGGRPAQVAVVHLQSPRLGQIDGLGSAFRVFGEMEDIHAREIAAIHAQLATNLPVFILGDFNSFSGGNAPRFLRERGWVDSMASFTNAPDAQVTWSARTLGREWSFRIDYLFHPAAATTLECRVIRGNASDHYLVVSRLAWKPQGQ